MSYNQLYTTTVDPHDEYIWPTQGDLALPDIQAISNLAGIAYGYDSGRIASPECAEEADFQFPQYDIQHIQTLSVQYGDAYEAYSREPHLQESSHADDDDAYYFSNGLLSTHRFLKGTPIMQSQSTCEPTRSSFLPDIQDSFASRTDSQEPLPTSLALHPFPSLTADDPVDDADSHPKIDHDFLLPNQRSTYSELSANLAYMAAQSVRLYEQETPVALQQGVKRRKREKVTTRIKSVDRQLQRIQGDSPRAPLSPGPSIKRMKTEGKGSRRRGPEPAEGSGAQTSPPVPERLNVAGSAGAGQDSPVKQIPPPRAVGRTSTFSVNRPSTKKKLGLACLFCRERKIACGRPSESSPDQTCNQCARRYFKCEYPIESRRGQHKRPKIKPVAD
ncbi:transcriptional regulator family: Fungal Specific TF [Agaricus bisporus var. burnettii]|uniref:Transcriptional regulator family: Fungal Specific TF n=1 Tax=Agaricus bisporus var. burnettii TaxID=192524 RepID=A0A8H7C433_AGABI|nr:transcriptional regulator family: Fungal Specific TF [Agaricus bisporus var. burnettii]